MFLEEFLIKIGVDASKTSEIAKVINVLQSGANKLVNLSDDIQKYTNNVVKKTGKLINEASGSIGKTKDKLTNLNAAFAAFNARAGQYGKKIVGAFNFNNIIDKAVNKTKSKLTNLKAAFAAFNARAGQYGKKIVSAFNFNNIIDKAVNKTKSNLENLKATFAAFNAKVGQYGKKIVSTFSFNNTDKDVNNSEESTDEVNDSADRTTSKLANLKDAFATLIVSAVQYKENIVSAFNNAIDKAEELSAEEDILFKISQKELDQAKLYKQEMNKTELALESIKTKIALGITPVIIDLIGWFRNWLTINKEVIADGIDKIIKSVSKVIQVVANFIKFIDKIVTSTIGWENALIVLGVAWAVFNRAFLASPMGIVIGLLTVLMLLFDDLRVYMEGGKSLFGEYWQPFIDGAKAAWEFLKTYWEFIKAFWSGNTDNVKSSSNKLFELIKNGVKSLVNGIKSLLSNLLKNILILFDMSEEDAKKTVDRIGKIFSFIFDLITFPYRTAYKTVCTIMDWLGINAGDVVNAIGEVFKAIWKFITDPFKSAWKSVNDLFDIWEDDTTTRIEKIKKTFEVITDHITRPFKTGWDVIKELFKSWTGDSDDTINSFDEIFSRIENIVTAPFEKAIKWIKDEFFGFINTVENKMKSAFSWTGLFDDDKDAKKTIPKNVQAKLNTELTSIGGVSSGNTINNNKAVTINNTMNVTTAQEGFDNLNNISNNAIRNIADNTATAMGYN